MKFVTDYNKEAVIYKEEKYTYKDIIKSAKYFSSLLKIEKREDKVVIFMENRPAYIYSFFSIWNAKATPINIDAAYNVDELLYILNDAAPKYIFTSNKNLKIAKEAVKLSNKDIKILNVDELKIPENFKVDEYVIYSPREEDIAVLLYTSGTTGNPKGVMLTFDNILSNVDAVTEIKLATPEDRLLALLPYHHILPLSINLLLAIHIGTLIVINDEMSAQAIQKALKDYKITIFAGVPRLWEMFHKGIMKKIKENRMAFNLFKICKKINSPILSKIIFKKVHEGLGGHIKFLVSGGAKIEPEIIENFKVLGIKIIEGYGLTETSPIISFNRPNNIKIGTVGTTIPGVHAKINDDGEIVIKGRNVMKGYYNKLSATQEVIDDRGWFHTGDLGKIENGYLTIIGRKKEMIVLSNGKNINPNDIENEVFKGTDLIKDIAIIDYNNHLLALIYPDFERVKERKIINITETLKWEIIDSYNVKAPTYRKILEIKIVKEELPKTKLGKLRRFMLKDFLKNQENNNTNEKKEIIKKDNPEYETKEFKALAKYMLKEHELDITPESHIEIDLGLDSLDIVEMNAFIENTFSFTVDEEKASEIKVISEICEYIRKNSNSFNVKEVNWKEFFNKNVDYPLPSYGASLLIKILIAPIFKFYLKLTKKGIDKLSDEPRIFALNHESFVDGFALSSLLPNEKVKNTYYFAIKKHFDSPIKKYVANHSNILLVDINSNLKTSLQVAAKVLKEGKNLAIFPEGARSRDGELQNFKKFFAILSKELNIPITVIGLNGFYKSMPFGSKFPKKSNLTIEVLGDVIPMGKEVDEIVNETKNLIIDWKEKNSN